jgi:hypothetical protein
MYQWMVIENYNHFYDLFRKIPLEVIDEIDRLWVKYSEGKFGIKGQAKIYRDLGGTEEYNGEVWESFGDRVGWREGGRWLELEEVAYHATTHQNNHFPILLYSQWGGRERVRDVGWCTPKGVAEFKGLFSRVKT